MSARSARSNQAPEWICPAPECGWQGRIRADECVPRFCPMCARPFIFTTDDETISEEVRPTPPTGWVPTEERRQRPRRKRATSGGRRVGEGQPPPLGGERGNLEARRYPKLESGTLAEIGKEQDGLEADVKQMRAALERDAGHHRQECRHERPDRGRGEDQAATAERLRAERAEAGDGEHDPDWRESD